MECSWDAALLRHASELPPELLQIIQQGSDERYLEAITQASLDPRFTYLLFAHCEPLYAHVLASLRKYATLASSVATLGRIIPFAPYLKSYAQRLLNEEPYVFTASCDSEDDLLYLLGFFRLLSNDWRTFKPFIKASDFAPLLQSSRRSIVYLAIRILQIHLSGADHWFEEMIKRYLGVDTSENAIAGRWDDRMIDYRFLTLWEEERFRKATKLFGEKNLDIHNSKPEDARMIATSLVQGSAALVGDWLLPRSSTAADASSTSNDDLVQTVTTFNNLCLFASAIRSDRPIMLTGLAGSGKSSMIRHVARKLGKLDDMITLHLNEQSDAKLLIGIYTTGDTPGTFVWKPGVLTQAIQQGRWVVIEDLDRAPKEIIGTILSLIENRQLMIPSMKQVVHARPGFQIIATLRDNVNHRGQQTRPLANMLGARHWHHVPIASPNIEEIAQICGHLFQPIAMLLPQMLSVYENLQSSAQRAVMIGKSRSGSPRTISPKDLFKWCHRVNNLLYRKPGFTSKEMDGIFLEAIDCFGGWLPSGSALTDLAASVAEQLSIDPQRRDHLLEHEANYESTKQKVSVGRYSLSRVASQKQHKLRQESFSTNPHTCHMLERVAAAVVNREPMLLVGETGVGKTTAVQHLANHLGKKLVAFNLSQQSEAGDLLGGFKPINIRSIVVPLKDEFDELFAIGFSRSKNQRFLELVGKQTLKNNWKAVCKLWRQALEMVDQQRAGDSARSSTFGEAPSKKRKVEPSSSIDFVRWDAFASKVYSLEKLVASGSNALAFSFVEGSIVKAVRHGDWILLDEINLASPDTLESIADLFDTQDASIVLTESGNIERIHAHPDFRVFAAMNPATDVGKKDLPPGIRSRFTEIYVESPDKDIRSLQSIVKSYLRDSIANDQAVASDVSMLYQRIIGLAEGNQLVDGAGERPHFSLRTLTRTLSYAKHIAPLCNIRRALYEGIQMSFMTFLDVESANLVEPLIKKLMLGKRLNTNAELSRALRRPEDGRSYVQGHPSSRHWIRRGKLPVEEQAHYIITPFIRRNLENLIRATSTRKFPILLQGPTSSGKTSMIEFLAQRSGHKFVRINNHEHTDLQEYLGTYTSDAEGRLQYEDGILVKALREGHWIVLDELNLAPTDVLEALNRLLDDNRELLIPETQEYIRPHEDFMLFATQNPAGLYGGRKTLSRAFRNRFLELHFDDIPVDELQEILHKRTQLPESRCKRIVTVYKELSVLRQESRMFEQRSFATLRDLFRWALRPNETVDQLAINGFMLLGERVRKPEERQTLKAILERVMSTNGPRVHIDEDSVYAADNVEIRLCQESADGRGVTWTRAMLRLYTLVARAIANNEPVLLVGETGCGKTMVCQMLADAVGKQLHAVNAHQNTETGDIIGSQRPIRNRAVIEMDLRSQLLSCPLLSSIGNMTAESTHNILGAYDQALALLPETERTKWSASHFHADIQSGRTRYMALFEWVDGSLVQAMKNGDVFLLDEISLADDSVLERLNSILEPQRSITLAEKGSNASFVTAAPGFQFLATMNPGGDYGKRELSPALRNRFTEIWVPPLNDIEDIMLITTTQLPERAKHAAAALVQFAQWFNGRYNTSASSCISLRDLLSWVSFIKNLPKLDVLDATIHGACMVYIDAIGANPAGLMSNGSRSVDEERKLCITYLGKLLQTDAGAIYYQTLDVRPIETGLVAGTFFLPKGIASLSRSGEFSFEASTTRTNTMRVVRAMQLPKPILLEGNPGVGKTALVTAIADAVDVPLTRINLSEQTDLLDLFGTDVPVEGSSTGTFAWRDASFLRAMKRGEWVLLDEMNLASQSVLEGLNACLDHRGEVFVPELGQSFPRHPNFRLFAAQNPHQQGGGRKGLPASFVNRFTVTHADAFRREDLIAISQKLFPTLEIDYIKSVISFVEQLERETVQSKRIGNYGGPWEFNLRDISRWLSLASSQRGLLSAASANDFADCLFMQRFRSEHDRAFVKDLFRHMFDKQHQAPSDLYPSMTSRSLQVGVGISDRGTETATPQPLRPGGQWSNPHFASIQSVMICVQENWPVILTGPSGAGKSILIARLAAAVGAECTTIAMNADSDAMDLIGGFDQQDLQRKASALHAILRSRLESLVREQTKQIALSDVLALSDSKGVHEIASRFSALQAAGYSGNADQVDEIQSLFHALESHDIAIQKAQFEWIDGLLVDALQEGKWLVLDNANLCSPSVLDRLNSLLEPCGTLIINEHSTVDGSPRIIRPHKDFRVFLTYDPRYGELSRAMRNRAVELHVPLNAERAVTSQLDPLHMESAISRFRVPAIFDSVVQATQDPADLAHVLADQAGFPDVPLLPRLVQQLHIGLFGLPDQVVSALDQAYSAAPTAALQATDTATSTGWLTISQPQASADYACVQVSRPASAVSTHRTDGKNFAQTFHPLNNQALVFSSAARIPHSCFSAFTYEYLLQAGIELAKLNTLSSDQGQVSHLRRLERSLGPHGVRAPKAGGSLLLNAVYTALRSFSTSLQSPSSDREKSIRQSDIQNDSFQLEQMRRFLRYAFATWSNLVRHLREHAMDATALLTYSIAAGQGLRDEIPRLPSVEFDPIVHAIKTFTVSVAGQHEQGFKTSIVLWNALRPQTTMTREHTADLCRLQSVISDFDRICWSFKLPLDLMCQLRRSFSRTFALATQSGHHLADLTDALIKSTEEHTLQIVEDEVVMQPHFLRTFQGMLGQFAMLELAGQAATTPDLSALEILAMQRTEHSIDIPEVRGAQFLSEDSRALRYLAKQVIDSRDSGLDGSTNFTKELSRVSDVGLSGMYLLENEVQTLGKLIASNSHQLCKKDVSPGQHLTSMVHTLLAALSNAHGQSFSVPAVSLLELLISGESSTTSGPDLVDENSTYPPVWVRLREVIKYCKAFKGRTSTDAAQAAEAWALFALSCLELYVPEMPIDPALYMQFHNNVQASIQRQLLDQLKALGIVSAALTGSNDSLRLRMLRRDVADAESPIQEAIVERPAVSRFGDLRTDVDALMRITGPLMQRNRDVLIDSLRDESLLTNIICIRTRLETVHRDYDDIVQPLLGFIDCLLLAHRLATTSDDIDTQNAKTRQMSQLVPFAGAEHNGWASGLAFVKAEPSLQTWQDRLLWLQAFALHKGTLSNCDGGLSLFSLAEQQFKHFFFQWSSELRQGQRQQAEKSNLYKFKGQENVDDDLGDAELEELFPGEYDSESKVESSVEQQAQSRAHLIADVHTSLFSSENIGESSICDVLVNWSSTSPNSRTFSIDEETFPAFLLRIKGLQLRLSGNEVNQNYNIYKDANVQQSRYLHAIVQNTMQRFRTLHQQFQDMHTKPLEVLEIGKRILQISHATPLSQMLPYVEKLQNAVREWQAVASREYSVHLLIESLTDLIVSWRRLELSSWLGLFKSERERSVRDAKSWWFIAYESILAAFEGSKETRQELQDLLSSLSGFLTTCGLGEWHTRLQVLQSFEAHLAYRAATDPTFRQRHQAIKVLLSYYGHFSDKVKDALERGCKELEDQISGIVKVASWKDRNIEVLKQSAKSSHKKLARLVRKLRRLLAEPVSNIITSEVPVIREDGIYGDRSKAKSIPRGGPGGPGNIPQLQVWNERPMRLQHVDATANTVLAKMSRLNDVLSGADRLHTFVDDLRQAIAELQKATPSAITEDSKAIITHLKTRKRRLLADVLRDMRKMGFQPSMNEQALARQNSLEVIFANLPSLPDHATFTGMRHAENTFHRFLALMPTAREYARKHSEELSPAETSRSLSLLESILETAIAQCNTFASSAEELCFLEQAIQKLSNFCLASDQPPLILADQDTKYPQHYRICMLKPVITVARKLLEDQCSLSGKEYSQLNELLESTEVRLAHFLAIQSQMPELPPGISSQSQSELFDQEDTFLKELQTSLRQQSAMHPEAGPLLAHVLRWVSGDTAQLGNANLNGYARKDPNQWIQAIFDLIDSVLAKVQKVDGLTAELKGKEDVVNVQRNLRSALDGLRPVFLAVELDRLQSELAHLELDNDISLAILSSIVGAVFPILSSYFGSLLKLVQLSGQWFLQISRTGHALATSFIEIAQNGFCSPSGQDDTSKSSGNIESGTGLGDGEGANDISGDIAEDEDLSDLKNGEETGERQGDLEDEKDAVDMADEEFEGKLGDDSAEAETGEEEEGEESDTGRDDDDDQDTEEGGTGPDAVDEKMWDESMDKAQPDKELENKAGKPNESEDSAASIAQHDEQRTEKDDSLQPEDPSQEIDDDDDGVDQSAPEVMDPKVDEGDNLDLPDDFDIEGHENVDDDLSEIGSDGMDEEPDPQQAENSQADETQQDLHQEELAETIDAQQDPVNDDNFTEPMKEDTDPDPKVEPNDQNKDERKTASDRVDDPTPTLEDRQGAESDMMDQKGPGAARDGDQSDNDDELSDTETQVAAKGGRDAKSGSEEQMESKADQAEQEYTSHYKQLGDILEKWYNQHRDIEAAPMVEEKTDASQREVDSSHFEHLPDENTAADTQALGTSSMENAAPLDHQNAIELEEDEKENMDVEQFDSREERIQDQAQPSSADPNTTSRGAKTPEPTSFVQEPRYEDKDTVMDDILDEYVDDVQDMDEQLTKTHIMNGEVGDGISSESAQQLWAKHEENTRNLALNLAEQLRLILHPTQATRMRGDFRTGKRLNIKKIIPYIASSYKRDKIWMRRSVPSKRSYQVMLAIDDSKSMSESNAHDLAFDTLALVARSLTILEVGELSVVGFGDQVNVAHDFNMPFTSDSGSRMLQSFRFSQNKTDVQRLLGESIELFRDARLKASGSASDLWQLQLIISDGICEDHLAIRRLIRQAYEERIMVVFIVVDPAALTAGQTEGPKQSILDLQTADFVKDANGEMQLKMTKYLDTFPFRHYLIVRNVQDLPAVLAGALRQWFAETVEATG